MPGDYEENVEQIANDLTGEMVKAIQRDTDRTLMQFRENVLKACALVDGKINDTRLVESCADMIQMIGAWRITNLAAQRWHERRKQGKAV